MQLRHQGDVELGFFNLSEIPKCVTVAGALPGPLQGYTVYEAAVLSKGSSRHGIREISRKRGGCRTLVGGQARARYDLHEDPCEPVIPARPEGPAGRPLPIQIRSPTRPGFFRCVS